MSPALDSRDRYEQAAAIMVAFADRTGLTGHGSGRRYLWTDAFAVCNYLGLARATGHALYSEWALKLVDRVHHSLGRHRPDDSRTGWISGLDEAQGEAHPTRGGLRIGKDLPERGRDEPFDADLEWGRDGQYFHYLTKWMHALDQVARSTGRRLFNVWSRELLEAAHRAFVYRVAGGTRRRMHWKMSIDLSRPLVRSMGQHDALDGYVTCLELRAPASGPLGADEPLLDEEAAEFEAMIDRGSLETVDPLGLGGLMVDAYRLAQLAEQRADVDVQLKEDLASTALRGLERYARQVDLDEPAESRLAFRELGLAVGLRALAALPPPAASGPERSRARQGAIERLGAGILAFWSNPEHRRTRVWNEHRDINEVMLATALVPDGFLVLRATPQA